MPKVEDLDKIPWAKAFLRQPLIARLATCNPETLQPHVVPVWYEWDGGSIWISSFRSTRKVREIIQNPLASLVVDTDPYGEEGHTVIFEGRVELILDPETGRRRGEKIYARYLGAEGAREAEPQSWLHDPQHLLIRIVPDAIYAS
jgi:nitroimidazol reductase NimA-like FMN-containing flavoprotein (pyridoxamine 5'-phosphate oxidase superfamily)